MSDPAAILDRLDPAAIAERLESLRHEQKALRILLRATNARQKARPASDEAQQERDHE
jgi:hypothetical protein